MENNEADKLAQLLDLVKLQDHISPTKRVELADELNEIISETAKLDAVELRQRVTDFYKNKLEPIENYMKTPSDIKFYLDLIQISSSAVKRKLDEVDPYTEEFNHFFIGNGTFESWCPEGPRYLKQLCDDVVCLDYRSFLRPSILQTDSAVALKQRNARRPAQKLVAELKKPKEVQTQSEDNSKLQDNMMKALAVLCKLTNNGETFFPYFNFVINPHSLEQTIHNIFITSFLYNELYITTSVGSRHTLLIKPITENVKSPKTRAESMKTAKRQTFTVTMNYENWMIYKEKMNITEAVLPDLCSSSFHLEQLDDYMRFAEGVNFVQ